jgi:hypothetical protein
MEDIWTGPWYAVDDEAVRRAWEEELRKEIGPKHPLWNVGMQLVARRDDRDAAVFRLDDGRIAEVHVTWTGTAERDPWPRTAIFANVDHWRAAWLLRDEAEDQSRGC